MINFGGKYMQYLWLSLLILSVVLECLVTKAIFLCFVPAALAAMILAFVGAYGYIQIAVFAALTVLAFLFLRPLARKSLTKSTGGAFSVEDAVGMQTTVVECLDNLAGRGAVVVHGMEWAARTLSDEIVIEEGSRVEIIGVEGVKFICRKI